MVNIHNDGIVNIESAKKCGIALDHIDGMDANVGLGHMSQIHSEQIIKCDLGME